MKTKLLSLLAVFCFLSTTVFSQQGIPEKPQKQRLVTDFAQILSPQETHLLEAKLLNYYRQSSTQVAVVIVKSLNGYEKARFATELAQKWGIGSAKYNNGILLLVKPKYRHSRGEVFIATGYGLEGAATDLACGQIIRNLIIPHFKQNDYFKGIDKATTALIALTKGEYNEKIFPPQPKGKAPFSLLFLFFLFFVFLFVGRKKARGQYHMGSRGGIIPTLLLMDLLMGGRRGGNNFDNFSSGGGSFGGFGGFGGGSFGGGGAGGSW